MTPLGPSDTGGLLLRDYAVIELLAEDLEQLGPGVSRQQVCEAGATRWPDRLIRRLRRNGYVIEEAEDTFKLYERPAVPAGGPDASAAAAVDAAHTAGSPAGTVSAPRLFREAA